MVLIIAYGNSLRRDDGAGLLLGEALEQLLRERGMEVERLAVHQLTPELALSVADERVKAVVFADTRVLTTDAEGVALHVAPVVSGSLSAKLGHHLSPSVVMTYARLLYGREPPAWVMTVPGADFAHGEGLSETAHSALATLPQVLHTLSSGWPLTAPSSNQ